MQTIDTIIAPSKHVSSPHMNFVVDGTVLDELLNHWYPNSNLLGLIPTTLNWLLSTEEQDVVWQRFLDREGETTIVPILCCPDDLDFSCTLVVVETKITDESVEWHTFGHDQTQFDLLPNHVGTSVNWFQPVHPLLFDRVKFDDVARRIREWANKNSVG